MHSAIWGLGLAATLVWAPSLAAAMSAADFLERAAMTDLLETKTAELAERKASSADVKRFAHAMAHDHGSRLEDLSEMSTRREIGPPEALDLRSRAMLDRLRGMSGPDFDWEYMRIQVMAHERALELLDRAARRADEAEIRSFARQRTPILRGHLAEARQVIASLAGPQSMAAGDVR